MLGRASLSQEELLTVICEVEATVNSRPLSFVSAEERLIPLTPASFLQDLQEIGVPDLDKIDQGTLNGRLKYRQRLGRDLRFREEYLELRQMRVKGKDAIIMKVGDVVLISDDAKKRVSWPLARVIEVYPGKDGHVRCVKLQTARGVLMRPVQCLVPLEIPAASSSKLFEEDVQQERPVIVRELPKEQCKLSESVDSRDICTRSGRLVRVPDRLDLMDQEIYRLETFPMSQGWESVGEDI